jgi:hypothetical protein
MHTTEKRWNLYASQPRIEVGHSISTMFCNDGFASKTFFMRGQLRTKKFMLQDYNESRLKSSFRKSCGNYIDLFGDYKWSIAYMLKDLFHTLC